MDYNIYFHSDTVETAKPTQPKQAKPSGSTEDKTKPNPASIIGQVGSIIQSPDSLVGMAKSKAIGSIASKGVVAGVVVAASTVAINVAKNLKSTYLSIASSSSGDYAEITEFNNRWQVIHNIMTPYSTLKNAMHQVRQQRINNARSELSRIEFGGTMLNSKYGRYL